MRSSLKTPFLVLLCFLFSPNIANAQTLKLRWSKQFSQRVSWHARTSPGIILIMVGKRLTAVDEAEGQQLWTLPVIESSFAMGGVNSAAERGHNILEVPGMGILLLNRVKLPGDSDWRLVALNLMTGKRLWDQPQVDDLMTVVTLYESGHAILVSRRIQKRVMATELVLARAAGLGLVYMPLVLPYPYRFELVRIDLATGKQVWSSEYDWTFTPGTASVKTFGDHLFIYFDNRMIACLNVSDGELLWEDGKKLFGSKTQALPLHMVDGQLIYSLSEVHAVDPATQKEAWGIDDLGKITGMVVQDGLVVALGEKNIAAVEIASGKERWRRRAHGHTTNLVWDKATDAVLYTDWKGLHSVELSTGKALLDVRTGVESLPNQLRIVSPDVVVTIAVAEVCAYNFKTGKRLFSEGKLVGFFRSGVFMDNWPMPDVGEEMVPMRQLPSTEAQWDSLRKATLLTPEAFQRLQEDATETEGYCDAYETEGEKGIRKIWWVDPLTNREVEISPDGENHDVDRQLGMMFATNQIQMKGVAIAPAERPKAVAAVN
jgi:outer membrane protein assembly factor BamB